MDASALPPSPHFFGRKRNMWSKQSLHCTERTLQCNTRGHCKFIGIVCASLYQFQVVVAEPPKECLGALKRTGVVVTLETYCCFVNHVVQSLQHRNINWLGWHRSLGNGASAKNELCCVQQFGCKFATNLHLVFAKGGVYAGPSACCPVSNGVTSVLLEQVDRGNNIAFRLGHLFAIGVKNPS